MARSSTAHKVALPHGGPCGIDPKVGEILVAHMKGVCASTEKASFRHFDRRDALLKSAPSGTMGQLARVCGVLLVLATPE